MAKEWIAVLQAADAAARWHVHQHRKGAASEPYINHLLEVAMLVAEATEGKDPELVDAALLHDEHRRRGSAAISYSASVRTGRCRVGGRGNRRQKARKTGAKASADRHAHQKSQPGKILTLADKTSNLRALATSPPPDWSVKRRLEYVGLGSSGFEGIARCFSRARARV